MHDKKDDLVQESAKTGNTGHPYGRLGTSNRSADFNELENRDAAAQRGFFPAKAARDLELGARVEASPRQHGRVAEAILDVDARRVGTVR